MDFRGKTNKNNDYLKEIRKAIELTEMQCFEGVFTSTPNLQKYIEYNGLNFKVFTIEPCIDVRYIEQERKSKENEEVITIAFMGGQFRDKVFHDVVLPALMSLTNTNSIKLVCPSRIKLDHYQQNNNLEIVGIYFTSSLDLALMRYKKYSPSILLHCGPDAENNKYKTENALINAVQLGSALIVSDNMYVDKTEEFGNPYYISVQNTVDSWLNAIENLCSDSESRWNLYANAKNYCLEQYSYEKGNKVLEKAFSELRPANYQEIVWRMNEAMYDSLEKRIVNKNKISPIKEMRSLNEVPLAFTGGIRNKRSYDIVCQVDILSELGICFASYGVARGLVHISIFEKSDKLRESVLEFKDYVKDTWTYIEFDPIENAKK